MDTDRIAHHPCESVSIRGLSLSAFICVHPRFALESVRVMRRYLTTWRLFWSASLGAEMEYRANFIFNAIGSAMTLAGSLFVLYVFYGTGYEMGGWSWPAALAVMGVYTLLDGFQQMVLAPNRTKITALVREGTLDFVLLKPMDTQFWLSVRQVSLWGAPNLVLGGAMILYAGARMEPALGVLDYAAALVPIALAVAILYAMGFLLGTLTIWFVKMDNITYVLASLLEAGRYPIPGYSPAYRVFFTFVLPVAFMTTVPAQALWNFRATLPWLAGSVVVTVLLLATSRAFWRYALRYYTSASS